MKKFRTICYRIKAKDDGRERRAPLRLCCLSDLHSNVYEPDNLPVLSRVRAAWPDLILAGGDMLSGDAPDRDFVPIDLLARLVPVAPVYFVNGNHELQVRRFHPERYDAYIRALQREGVHVLSNRAVHRTVNGRRVCICGYELPWDYYHRFSRERPTPEEIRQCVGDPVPGEFTILLTHNPTYLEEYARWGADFVFAGHLHGGFLRLPLIGGVISPQLQLFPKYDRGLFQKGDCHMAVSAGMGNHSWLFRINNPAQLVLVEIGSGHGKEG